MKTVVLLFLLVLPLTAFTQMGHESRSRHQLEKRIARILSNRYGHQEEPAFSPTYSIGHNAYMVGLRKLELALSKTKNIRDFSQVGTLYMADKQDIIMLRQHNGKMALVFPVSTPAEAFIGLLSSTPHDEPAYRKYLQEKFVKKDKEDIRASQSQWSGFHAPPPSYLNKPIKSLDEIYGGCQYSRPLSEIQKIANRVDRVLVTILDSGVDYNHPDLAFKIPRPVDESTPSALQKSINRLQKAQEDLRQEYVNLNVTQRWSHQEEYQSQLADLERRIEEKKREKECLSRSAIPPGLRRSISRLQKVKKDLQQKYARSPSYWQWWYKDQYASQSQDLDDKIAARKQQKECIQKRAIGWDFRGDDNQPFDGLHLQLKTHGTHVAGIAAQGTDDIAILPLLYPKAATSGELFYEAIELAHQKGSRIVNVSLGSKENKKGWDHLSRAIEDYHDMLFVVAAGNDGANLDDFPTYPAAYGHPNILVVASVDDSHNLSRSSNYSKIKVDIAAPGENIESLAPEGPNQRISGTSTATPYLTRVAAQIKYINPSLTPRQIISIIRDSATPVDSLQYKIKYGGVVNEEKALQLARRTLILQ